MIRNIVVLIFLITTLNKSFAKDDYGEANGVFNSKAPHEMIILEEGSSSLIKRLEIINRAKKSINVEYYIYELDNSGRILMNAMIKKAKEGVKVRILLDNLRFIFEGALAKEMVDSGIQLKKYNNTKMFTSPRKFQYRDHRKLITVDGIEAVVGGRNIQNKYFMISDYVNKYDRDLYVKGELVKKVDETFEIFWNHKISEFPKIKKKYKNEQITLAKSLLAETEEDVRLIKRITPIANERLAHSKVYICKDTTFATDYPGTGKAGNFIADYLYKTFADAKDSLLIDNSYFVTQKKEKELFGPLLERGIDVTVLTNGLTATDGFITNALMQSRYGWYTKRGMKVHLFKGDELASEPVLTEKTFTGRFSSHSKTFVVDDHISIITSYNMDPRSKYYNREMSFTCENNKEMTSELRANIRIRMEDSFQLQKDGNLTEEDAIHFDKKLKRKAKIFNPFTRLIDRLI